MAEVAHPFGEWVGGRFSVWSSVGLPVAIALGMPAFEHFLAGAHAVEARPLAAILLLDQGAERVAYDPGGLGGVLLPARKTVEQPVGAVLGATGVAGARRTEIDRATRDPSSDEVSGGPPGWPWVWRAW